MNKVYKNGELVDKKEASVSVYDHGLLYGDGVFEGIRSYNGRIFKFDEHIDRLYNSALAIDLQIPLTKEEMKEAIVKTLRVNELSDAYIRPIVTRGVGSLGLNPDKCSTPSVIIITEEWDAMYGDLYAEGLNAITVCIRRNPSDSLPPNIKSLNYLNNILAKIEVNVKGGDEAIILNRDGTVSEGSGDNIFIVRDGEIETPPTLSNLRGITRSTVMDLASEIGYKVTEKELCLFDLYTCDEVFVTGTAAEIAPIVRIDGREIRDGRPGKITKELMERYEKITGNRGTPIWNED